MQVSYKVAFFENGSFDNKKAYKTVFEYCLDLLNKHQFVKFIVSKNTKFDLIVISAINSARIIKGKENSNVVLVLPYETVELLNSNEAFFKIYDEIKIFSRNYSEMLLLRVQKYMVDCCDEAIFYSENGVGTVDYILKYTKRKNKSTRILRTS